MMVSMNKCGINIRKAFALRGIKNQKLMVNIFDDKDTGGKPNDVKAIADGLKITYADIEYASIFTWKEIA